LENLNTGANEHDLQAGKVFEVELQSLDFKRNYAQ